MDRYNQPLFLGYEGGPATFGGNSVPGKVIANESPLMQVIIAKTLQPIISIGAG